SCQGQVERLGGAPRPIRKSLEAGVILVPLVGYTWYRCEEVFLFAQGGLLVVAAVKRIELPEELMGVRFHHAPRWIADVCIEATALRSEHVGKRQFPMKE